MKAKTKKRAVHAVGLALVPVLAFTLFLGAQTYDGSTFGKSLIVAGPLAIYAVGLYVLLAGLTNRLSGDASPSS